MLSIKNIIRSALFIGVMFTSCSEESDPKTFDTRVFSGENQKTWKVVDVVSRKSGREEISVFQFRYKPCERDDRYTFYTDSDKYFEVSNGLFECDDEQDDELLVAYFWSFNNATGSLSMVFPHIFGYYFIPFLVKEVDEDEMELEIFLNEEGTESYALFLEKVSEE